MVTGVPATISVRDLRKSYSAVRALDGVSFDVERGEFFGILGPNGAGKTTTLEIIEGLREADSGEVTTLGRHPWPRDHSLLPRALATAKGPGAATADAVTDDGVSLTIATREPAAVLAGLADRHALTGLRVSCATLEDVFLELTGRAYRA